MDTYTDTDTRKWIILARPWTTVHRDEDGRITRIETCARMAPEGYPEAIVERSITETPTPDQAAAIDAALAWQPKRAVETLVARQPKLDLTPTDPRVKSIGKE
jgi:hypothetical protein